MSRQLKQWTVQALLDHTEEVGDCLFWRGKMKQGWPCVYAISRRARDGDTGRQGREVVNVRWLMALLGGDEMATAEFDGRVKRGVWTCSCGESACVAPWHIRRRTLDAHLAVQRAALYSNPLVNAMRAEKIARTTRRQRSPLRPEDVPRVMELVAQMPQKDVAQMLGVSRHAVSQVVTRERRWRPVVGGVFSGLGGRG